jgi:hypothetical protein
VAPTILSGIPKNLLLYALLPIVDIFAYNPANDTVKLYISLANPPNIEPLSSPFAKKVIVTK